MTRLARSALAYATRLGWPVFPLFPRGKDPIVPKWRSGNGHLDATVDVEQIREWWTRWPTANIGIACDERSGLLVLDIDPRNGGDDELHELERVQGELPRTPLGLTGGGGLHYVFQRPADVRFRGQLAKGIDVKGNGYIVAPPSIHPDGPLYRWEVGAHPIETPLAELPSWVLQGILSYKPAIEYGQPADDAAKSFLARAFAHAGWLGTRIDAFRINCRCPWEDQHTQRSGSGGTVIFAPRFGGNGTGWFHCSHNSHGPKAMRDVMAVLPYEACRRANADICEEVARDATASVGDDYETGERLAIVENDQ